MSPEGTFTREFLIMDIMGLLLDQLRLTMYVVKNNKHIMAVTVVYCTSW